MAIANLLNLFDDIATVMDDVAILTKKASAKTVGLMGDDLAVNSEQMIGLSAKQEFPVVWKIFLGSLVNKIILIPIIFLLTTYLPIGLKIVLVLGGLFLCFEGAEKVVEKINSKFKKDTLVSKKKSISVDDRIKGAVKTDFILSIEILAIAASTMGGEAVMTTLISLSIVGLVVSAAIYGIVLLIIKLDDMGLALVKNNETGILNRLGNSLIHASPKIMKLLGFIGTVATFLVGGEILLHNFHLTLGLNKSLESLLFGILIGFILVSPLEIYHLVSEKKHS